MTTSAERLRGKEVVIKCLGRTLTAIVEDVNDVGVWIKGNALAPGQSMADISRPNVQGTAPNFAHPISFVPWPQVEYIVTESEHTP